MRSDPEDLHRHVWCRYSMAVDSSGSMDTGEESVQVGPKQFQSAPSRGILQQNRQFLDFFWDIAKPDQAVRLSATENLIKYLKTSEKEDELKYTFKRLVEGLAATREAARPGFSLALAQVLQSFEEIQLSKVLDQITEKHNLERAKKKVRNAAFGNFFGVLALFQSGRLAKDPKVLLQCVQILQNLAQFKEHLKDLPRKTLVDILSEIPESIFEEMLFGVLREDLTSAFSSPDQLHLLLVGMQKFPGVLKPKKLKKLLGSSVITTPQNIPRLVELLKTAARSVKKECSLPEVALDVMRISLKEDNFELFWREVVENGLLKDQSGPCMYMCYRLLGASLPLLDEKQLQSVLRSEVMLQYGVHVVSTQPAERFKFAPEMETYVGTFLENCTNPEKQLAVVIGFNKLTNQGYPVVPCVWKVIRHLQPSALQSYIDWLKSLFLTPDLGSCLDFSTRRQKQEQQKTTENMVFRLRKWIIPRLTSIIENPQVKRNEDQVMDITRFIFFHAFFEAKKSLSDLPETNAMLSVPLDETIRTLIANAFFSLLLNLNCMPTLGDDSDTIKDKHSIGVTAEGKLWIHSMVLYANNLLSQGKSVKAVKPFSPEQKKAWDGMLQYVENLQNKVTKSHDMKFSAYQQLLLLVGIHLFKTPEESVDLLNDIHNCLEKAQSKKLKKKKSSAEEVQEPEWIEVMVEILLSLFSQPSRLFRLVSRNVFKKICPYMTKNALQLILNVFDPAEDQNEESAIVVTEEKEAGKKSRDNDSEQESSLEEGSSDEDDEQGEEQKDSSDEAENIDENVNEVFRKQLMNVLQAGNAMEGDDSDEEVDDATMMALDKNLSALFSEQKKRIQAKKDEKARIRGEKILRQEFKTKVLDLVDVFVKKQPESPLVFNIIEPLISVIEQSMSSEASQLEQDFLRKTADIFMNDLCKAKKYCKDITELKEELHCMMERLVKRACKQSDSSVALYCFSASLYLFKVLRGSGNDLSKEGTRKNNGNSNIQQTPCLGCLDLERVIPIYQESLNSFLTKRKSPLTVAMFVDLFNRFPFMCNPLLDITLKSIKDGARPHQQGQACTLLVKALQTPAVKQTLSSDQWKDLLKKSIGQVKETLETVTKIQMKVDQEKVIKCFELLSLLIKTVNQQKLDISFTEIHPVLQAMSQNEGFGKSVRLEDMYWNIMTLFGYTRPKKEKTKTIMEETVQPDDSQKKKKGFLPETKKRKNRKKAGTEKAKSSDVEKKMVSLQDTEKDSEPKNKKKKNKKRKKPGQQAGAGPENSTEVSPSKKAKCGVEGNKLTAEKTKKKKKSKEKHV
ncbi:hypothetical protein GDO86_003858 [Hymenochirus boettgeri]|uniref:Myb-binding protein 1A n=1 Tax=Hymenochirus boettgeri TaxID=247094 RepID=A0A8T2KBE7_9PIPI|nr:hypothetical protein GDO86_003858 [Hymenochirus boettgeri]KAG8451816.1 hypothetical protein GDO86_003858 [Hymenochirus boettgeri]